MHRAAPSLLTLPHLSPKSASSRSGCNAPELRTPLHGSVLSDISVPQHRFSRFGIPFFGVTPPEGNRNYRREDIYELVWTRPLREVAKEFDVSDVALKKLCRRIDIPTPPQGYWLRTAERRASAVRPALPPRSKNQYSDVVISVPETRRVEQSSDAVAVARSAHADVVVPVAERLETPHRLVEKAGRYLATAKVDDGLVSSRARGGLDIRVAPTSVDRALRIADALLKTLANRGLQVDVTPPSEEKHWRGHMVPVPSRTVVQVNGESIEFWIAEATRTEPAPPPAPLSKREQTMRELTGRPTTSTPRRVRVPTGTLVLAIATDAGVTHWRDRKLRRLETFFPDFVAHLYLVADLAKQQRARDEAERARAFEQRRRKEEEARLAEEKKLKREQVHRQLENWRLVRDLRDFASSIRAVVEAGGMKVQRDGGVYQHLEFILAYANELDPLGALREEVAALRQR